MRSDGRFHSNGINIQCLKLWESKGISVEPKYCLSCTQRLQSCTHVDSTEINQIYEQIPVCNISATYFVSYGSQDPRLDIFSILQMCVNQNKYLSHKSSKTGCSQAYARNLGLQMCFFGFVAFFPSTGISIFNLPTDWLNVSSTCNRPCKEYTHSRIVFLISANIELRWSFWRGAI